MRGHAQFFASSARAPSLLHDTSFSLANKTAPDYLHWERVSQRSPPPTVYRVAFNSEHRRRSSLYHITALNVDRAPRKRISPGGCVCKLRFWPISHSARVCVWQEFRRFWPKNDILQNLVSVVKVAAAIILSRHRRRKWCLRGDCRRGCFCVRGTRFWSAVAVDT